jgi:hypothetical protein
MRIVVAALLAVHGAIHFIGFAKWARVADIPEVRGTALVLLGPVWQGLFAVAWLLAGLLCLSAMFLRLTRNSAWWPIALTAILLSQTLVVAVWADAKWGTLANLAVALAVALAAARDSFRAKIEDQVDALLSLPRRSPPMLVQPSDLSQLPPPVRRWLNRAQVVGTWRPHTVRLKQRGLLRAAKDGRWMPAQATQYFNVDDPGFVWRVDARMLGFLPIAGRDSYRDGVGRMTIKLASLVGLVDEHDARIAEGALLRFLGEIVWFPAAALHHALTWEAIDAQRARATLRDGALSVTAVFVFDDEGRVVGIEANRYFGGGADARRMRWVVRCTAWDLVRGVEIPTAGEVSWLLPDGPFPYYQWEILDVEADHPELYSEESASTTEKATWRAHPATR